MDNITDQLYNYAIIKYDYVKVLTDTDKATLKTIAAVVAQAIIDLRSRYKKHKSSAEEYIASARFRRDCNLLCLPRSLINTVIENHESIKQ